MEWQATADLIVGAAVPVGGTALYLTRRIDRREALLLIWGFCIGLSFELFIGLQGENFIKELMRWPMPRVTIYIWHAFWDAGLFMAGYALVAPLLRRPRKRIGARFDWKELGVMTAWGAVSSVAVELTGNGVVWLYRPQSWNPVVVTLNGVGYTPFIHIVWLVVPSVFYAGCLKIKGGKINRSIVR